jgi:asparagine synthetase B (glutamine-hydrolysing)
MCGICLIYKLKLSQCDLTTLQEISQYNASFNDFSEDSVTETLHDKGLNDWVSQDLDDMKETIGSRGPDYFNIVDLEGNTLDINTYGELFGHVDSSKTVMISSVLNLRGIESITKQPICDGKNILQYNGEIYDIKNQDIDLYVNNDGYILSKLLGNISLGLYEYQNKDSDINSLYSDRLFKLLNDMESDHSFVYSDRLNNKLILSRDIFGKRSLLLVYILDYNVAFICSVLPKSLYENRNHKKFIIIEIPANSILIIDHSGGDKKINFYQNSSVKLASQLRFSEFTEKATDIEATCYKLLKEAVFKRVCNLPEIVKNDSQADCHVAVLFSGGIDSLLLAYFTAINLADYVTIDLINLSFDGSNAPDRNSGLLSYYELITLLPDKQINLILVDKSYDKDVEPLKDKIQRLIFPKETHMDFNISTALHLATKLEGQMVNRLNFFEYMGKYYETVFSTKDVKLTDNYNNDILSKKLTNIDYSSFIEKEKPYKSKSKIVLHGLGADEFFGGYSRYKSSYLNGGTDRLKDEMSKDIDRIWTRNFGRDDRVCSDNGIELRYPFFDYKLLDYLSSVDLKEVTNFEMPRGMGEKILLRKVCQNIGFKISHSFEKRAIQFGTKLAKETNIKKYGSNRKANGKAQYK